MKTFLVVVMLTFADGSVAQHNDGKWESTTTFEECQKKAKDAEKEMREMFKDNDPAPSTFIKICAEEQ